MLDALRRPQILTAMAVLALVGLGSIVLVFAVRSWHSETRFMALVRPQCAHMGLTDDELRRLARSEYQSGPHKVEAVRAVSAICESGHGSRPAASISM